VPAVRFRADHLVVLNTSAEVMIKTCLRCHRNNIKHCPPLGVLLMPCHPSPFQPPTRGPEWVRPSARVQETFTNLLNNGYNDIVLADGVHYRINSGTIFGSASSMYPAQKVSSFRSSCSSTNLPRTVQTSWTNGSEPHLSVPSTVIGTTTSLLPLALAENTSSQSER
jgi:hypothetical protein